MPVQATPYIILLGTVFGTSLIASRFAVGLLSPSTFIGLRLALASLGYIFLYLISFQGRKWPRDPNLWRHGALYGVFGTAATMNLIAMSLQYLSSGLTAIMITLIPAGIVVLAHFFLEDEPLTWRKSLGVAMAMAGAVFLALRGESGLPDASQSEPIGYILIFAAILCDSGMTIYARKYMRDLDTFDVGFIRMITAAVVVLPLSVFLIGFDLSRMTQAGYFSLGWASLVGTFIGVMFAFYSIKRFGATATAMAAYIIPIAAGIGGVWLLDEQITGPMLGGMGLILIGIAIINQRGTLPMPLIKSDHGL